MQNRKKDTDVQNRLLDSVEEGEGGMFQENSIKSLTVLKSTGQVFYRMLFNLGLSFIHG